MMTLWQYLGSEDTQNFVPHIHRHAYCCCFRLAHTYTCTIPYRYIHTHTHIERERDITILGIQTSLADTPPLAKPFQNHHLFHSAYTQHQHVWVSQTLHIHNISMFEWAKLCIYTPSACLSESVLTACLGHTHFRLVSYAQQLHRFTSTGVSGGGR